MCTELVHSPSDCWVGIKDPKKRKQIQDRLAQRARRKRLAEAKKTGTSSKSGSISNAVSSSALTNNATRQSGISCTTGGLSSSPPPTITVYAALWKNGDFLGLRCTYINLSPSNEAGPEVPDPLRPTPTQLSRPPPSWIDRFPFPLMRDNFISLLGVIDPEDFCRDLYLIPSFSIRPGGSSWDPASWSIEKEFQEKWGFLFDPNLFGESGLTPDPVSPSAPLP